MFHLLAHFGAESFSRQSFCIERFTPHQVRRTLRTWTIALQHGFFAPCPAFLAPKVRIRNGIELHSRTALHFDTLLAPNASNALSSYAIVAQSQRSLLFLSHFYQLIASRFARYENCPKYVSIKCNRRVAFQIHAPYSHRSVE